MFPFYNTQKTQNLDISRAFRGYKTELLAWNMLMCSFLPMLPPFVIPVFLTYHIWLPTF